jgi:transposase InsO family protein
MEAMAKKKPRPRRSFTPGFKAEVVALVRPAVVRFIEIFYNRKRPHSSLDYLTPVEYEANLHHKSAHAV